MLICFDIDGDGVSIIGKNQRKNLGAYMAIKIKGDCISVMRGMQGDSFDAVVTSPPYNIGVDYGDGIQDNLSQDEYNSFTKAWIKEALRVSKVCVVNFGAPTSKPTNLAHFMLCLSDVGIIQTDIVWVKSVSTETLSIGHFKPVNSQRYLTNLVEHIFVVSRDGNYPLDKLSVGVPFADKSNIKRFKSNKSDLRCRGNVWLLPYKTRTKKLQHPATYPQELAEMMIKIVGAKSVLDPFYGTGNTGLACESLGVGCTGIDIKEW